MLCLKTEVKINLGMLQVKRDGAGAAVVFRESYDTDCRQPKTFGVFLEKKKRGGGNIEFRNPRRNGAVF